MCAISPILAHVEAGNHRHQVLELEPLEVWRHRELVLVMGSAVLLPVQGITMIMLFIYIVKLWIIFLSVVETLVVVSGG